MSSRSRPAQRLLFGFGLLAGLVFGQVGAVLASCIVPFEPVSLVTGRLAGERVEERFHANLGEVLGVVELETVHVWEALPGYTAASATVVSRYWGERPPDDRFFMDGRFNARIDGGHFTGPRAPETTISCDPSVAQPLGSYEYVAVFEHSSFVPIESGVTPDQEAIFTQHLGEPISVALPTLPDTHPNADTAPVSLADFGDVDDVATTPYWLFIAAGAVLIAGMGLWLRRRRPSVATQADANRTRTNGT